MAVRVRSHVSRVVHASVRRRTWTTASLSAAMLGVLVVVVVVLAWESTVPDRLRGTGVDVDLGDETWSGMTIVGGSPFAAPLRRVADATDAGGSIGVLVGARRQRDAQNLDGAGATTKPPAAPRPDGDAPSDERPDASPPRRPAPKRPPATTTTAPKASTPIVDSTAPTAPVVPAPTAVDPTPVTDTVEPLPQVEVAPIAAVDATEPSAQVGPVAGVSAGVDTDGATASAPLVGDLSVSLG